MAEVAAGRRVKRLEDPIQMRAIAHPLRLRLLGELRIGGPATATMLARRFEIEVSLPSYHLRQLATHGFIEDDEGHEGGRERWWRAAQDITSWDTGEFLDTPERRAAEASLRNEILRLYVHRLEEFIRARDSWSDEWLHAAFSSDMMLRLTPEQAKTMHEEMWAVIEKWDVAAKDGDAEGTELVHVIVHGFPTRRPGR